MKQIPNLFTLLNLVFGCLAIVFTLQNGIIISTDVNGSDFFNIPEKIVFASICIGAAGLVDFLDGFVARLFKATSEMGKQLDSLADVVSFGVAPSMILYQFLRMSFGSAENGIDAGMAWLLPAFIVAAAAAYRLAKFNIDDSQQYGFKGVPTPAAGILIASLPLIYWYTDKEFVINLLLNKWFLYAVIIAVSYLMVSNLPIMALKFKDYTLKNNMPKIILLAIAVAAALILKWIAVPVVFVAYIIVSLALKNKTS
jgi:CDP-diacylglycerol--serine O-phosphatidyltransferase